MTPADVAARHHVPGLLRPRRRASAGRTTRARPYLIVLFPLRKSPPPHGPTGAVGIRALCARTSTPASAFCLLSGSERYRCLAASNSCREETLGSASCARTTKAHGSCNSGGSWRDRGLVFMCGGRLYQVRGVYMPFMIPAAFKLQVLLCLMRMASRTSSLRRSAQ